MRLVNTSSCSRDNDELHDVRLLIGSVLVVLFLTISSDVSAVVRCEQPGDLTGINVVSPPESLPVRHERFIVEPEESGLDQYFGIGLALQPPMLAVGQANNPLSERGKVELFHLKPENWDLAESFDPPNPGPYDAFFRPALTEDLLAIGDYQWCPDDSSCDRGQINLYRSDSGEQPDWELITTIEGPVRFSEFGRSQAFDGNRLAFVSGIPDEGTPERVSRYSVLTYEPEEGNPDEWTQTARLRIPDSISKNFYMRGSVGAVNDQIFIGASEDDGDISSPNNQAWLHWTLNTESGQWVASKPLPVPSTCQMRYSYDGKTLVFSWTDESEAAETTALVFFERNGNDWQRVFELDTTEHLSDLSIDDDRLVVRAVSNDFLGYVIGRKTDGTWEFVEKLVTDGPMVPRRSGGVEFKDGIIAFGSYGSGPAEYENRGTVFVYNLQSFGINPGMNDAWYNPLTNGQGFLFTVFPSIQQMFVAWFTFDAERPAEDITSIIGEPGHRWLTAQGPYSGDTATLTIYMTEGGVFDSATPAASADPAGDGTLTLEFADCSSAIATYEITSAGLSGSIPLERIAEDNVTLCETLANQ